MWKLYEDGSSNDHNSGAGIILISPEGHKFQSDVRFSFASSNNKAEYDALLIEIGLAKSIQVKVISV